VGTIEPHTEADPVAILLHILVGFGNLIGSGPHFRVEHTLHPLRLFTCLVGETSKARKGTAWSTPRHLLAQVDPSWAQDRVTSGLSSGEGLIAAVCDGPVGKDKRLLVVEEEFAQVLKVMRRDGSILSPTLRQAWDTGNLSPLTKNNPIRATGAHISVIGHITREELLRHLTETEQANGLANRFLWALVRRSKKIPNPTGVPASQLNPLAKQLQQAAAAAGAAGELKRSPAAETLWCDMYADLSEGKPGLLGAVLGRAEALVMRLACLYALLDCATAVQVEHLEAAAALWQYAEESARQIFGSSTGNPLADRIKTALEHGREMDETEIHNLLGRNMKAADIWRALDLLKQRGLVTAEERQTAGRPKTVWRVTN